MKSKDSIRLSAKHGLQPTIPVCRYCRKEKNCVVLLGARGDKLARDLGAPDGCMPMHTVLPDDFEPCEECSKDHIALVACEQVEHKGKARLKPVKGALIPRVAIKNEDGGVFEGNIIACPYEEFDQIKEKLENTNDEAGVDGQTVSD